jgi:hypothetical protein
MHCGCKSTIVEAPEIETPKPQKNVVKNLIKIGKYHLFMTALKRTFFGLGLEIGTGYESEHFCTRDFDIIIGPYYLTFWIEDGT